jgi:ribonucleoside-diphosphate reductase alpha chain
MEMAITEKSIHPQPQSTAPDRVDKGLEASTKGLTVQRRFSRPEVNPLDEIEYEYRRSVITEPDGTIVFEMNNVEVPKTWTQLATDIVVSKYFRKAGVGSEKGTETSARQVVHRIANTIRVHGEKKQYFATAEDAAAFEAELAYMLITQRGAFNSPVWFNCGLFHQYGVQGSGGNWYHDEEIGQTVEASNSYERPQCSACFIQSVDDDLMSLFDLAKNEARLFKFGSGTGTNFSKIRGRQEKLSGGGTSSGLMSFLEVLDRGAGATKSGGTTRRAAKMVTLDMDHPEIADFINWKLKEERKVKVLIDAGYPSDFNGEAYHTVAGQNSNNSVRISDAFMHAYLHGDKWETTFRTTGEVCDTYEAKDLMKQIAYAAWACADPGVQFDDITNDWHTCSNTDRIYGSNPCSEYHFLNDTACNLASINLMLFYDEDSGVFDVDGFRHACRVFFVAQEILVGLASYPTKVIAENSYKYRPLGLGYANLGAMLMVNGIPYDSDESYAIAGAITAIMCGHAYRASAELAAAKGAFEGYENNRAPMLRVMGKHRNKAYEIPDTFCPDYLVKAAREDWDDALELGEKYGYRNAQATVLAPTGTIGLLMDCDTTGIEPDFALVKWKKLAGGGYFKIANQAIPRALRKLGYTPGQVVDILTYILGHGSLEGAPHMDQQSLKSLGFTETQIQEAYTAVVQSKSFNEWTPGINTTMLKEKGWTKEQLQAVDVYVNGAQTIEGSPHLKDEHLPVFDCANPCGVGVRYIDPMAHIKIMAATQPFLSGAISKTVNLPNDATVEEIEKIYVDAWHMGLKCVALYRDGSKMSQVLNVKSNDDADTEEATQPTIVPAGLQRGDRRELPRKREGLTIDATVNSTKVYLRTGEYEDGKLGEVFIDMFKEGASYRSLLNCFAVAVSLGLQYGVPLEKFVNQFTFTRFEPSGFTDHPNIRNCTSILDYIFRVLGMEYLGETDYVQVKPDTSTLRVNTNSAVAPFERVQHPGELQTVLPIVKENGSGTANGNGTEHPTGSSWELSLHLKDLMGDAPPCDSCGNITVRNGSCYRCLSCGNSMGCS